MRDWLRTWLAVDWFNQWLGEDWVKKSLRNKVLLALAWLPFVIGGAADFILNRLELEGGNQ